MNRKKSNGFTLLEVLIASAILTVILTMAYTILITTLNSRKYIDDRAQIERIGNRLLDFIGRDIQGAYMYQVQDDKYFFARKKGKNTEIDFISNTDSILLAPGGGHSDLCEVGYLLRANKGSDVFRIIRREDFFVDDDPYNGGTGIKLYDNITSFRLKFYDGTRAISEWDSKKQKKLPRAVEIQLGIKLDENIRIFKRIVPLLVSPKLPKESKKKNKKSEKNNNS